MKNKLYMNFIFIFFLFLISICFAENLRFNRREAEKRGFAWGFCSCFGIEFSLYKSETQSWNATLIEALMSNTNIKFGEHAL